MKPIATVLASAVLVLGTQEIARVVRAEPLENLRAKIRELMAS